MLLSASVQALRRRAHDRPSAGGRMYYYVFLYYSDESLETERSSQYMEEL